MSVTPARCEHGFLTGQCAVCPPREASIQDRLEDVSRRVVTLKSRHAELTAEILRTTDRTKRQTLLVADAETLAKLAPAKEEAKNLRVLAGLRRDEGSRGGVRPGPLDADATGGGRAVAAGRGGAAVEAQAPGQLGLGL